MLILKELPYDEDALPSACPTALLEAMKACLKFAPAARPRFSQLALDLGSPEAAVAAYLEKLTITPEVGGGLLFAFRPLFSFVYRLLFCHSSAPLDQVAKLIANHLFQKHKVVAVKDLADLRPETVDRIALTLNLGDVSAPKFVDACEELREKRARGAAIN